MRKALSLFTWMCIARTAIGIAWPATGQTEIEARNAALARCNDHGVWCYIASCKEDKNETK